MGQQKGKAGNMANTTTWVARHSMIQNGWQASVNKGVGTKAKDVLHTHTSKVHNILTIARRDIAPLSRRTPAANLCLAAMLLDFCLS